MQGAMQSQLWRGQVTPSISSTTPRIQTSSGLRGMVRASAGEREVKAKAVIAEPPVHAEDRLVPRVEQRDGFWVLKEEYRQSLNPAEKVRSYLAPKHPSPAHELCVTADFE